MFPPALAEGVDFLSGERGHAVFEMLQDVASLLDPSDQALLPVAAVLLGLRGGEIQAVHPRRLRTELSADMDKRRGQSGRLWPERFDSGAESALHELLA